MTDSILRSYYNVTSSMFVPFAAVADDSLLVGEANGLAADFSATTYFNSNTWDMDDVQVRTSSVDVLSSPHVFFTQSGTSPKVVQTSATGIGWAPHNYCLQSEVFGTTWSTDSTHSVSSNATTAPDGTVTADKITPLTDASGVRYVYQNVTPSGNNTLPFTGSVYAKAAGYNFVAVWTATGSNTYRFQKVVDLTNGTVSATNSTASPTGTGFSITDVGSGWYRIAITQDQQTSFSSMIVSASSTGTPTVDGGLNPTFTGNGTDGVYVWGGHVNRGSVATAYIKTTTAARIGVPISYGQGLWGEPAATNLMIYSQAMVASTGWFNDASTSFTQNATTAPDGSTTADKVAETAGGVDHYAYTDAVSFTSGTAYTLSCYAKQAERNWLRVGLPDAAFPANAYCMFDLNTGAVAGDGLGAGATAGAVVNIGNGWYRISVTATADATTTGVLLLLLSDDGTASGGYSGTGGNGLYVWGTQCETGAVATSYIPTVGASATRAKDAISVLSSAFPTSATAMSFLVYATLYGRGGDIMHLTQASSPPDNTLEMYSASGSNDLGQYVDYLGGGAAVNVTIGTHTTGTIFKIAARYKGGDYANAFNGTLGATSSFANFPTAWETLRMVRNPSDTQTLNGMIARIIVVPRDYSNAELQAKTT